jgi:GAF domain-containing protein
MIVPPPRRRGTASAPVGRHEGDDVPDPAASRRWLLSRVDQRCLDGAEAILRDIVEALAIATADAVAVRVLAEDGQWLLPVVAYHPDPDRSEAITAVMGETPSAATGLWLSVIETRQPRRWRIPPGFVPPEASPRQAEFLGMYPIRAVLGVPLLLEDRVVGSVALIRFSVDQEFTDHDEELLLACGRRLARALDFRTKMTALAAEGGTATYT